MHEATKRKLEHIINGIGVVDRRHYSKSRKPADRGVSRILVALQQDLLEVLDMEERLSNGTAEAEQGREGEGVLGSGGEAPGVPSDGVAEADPDDDSSR